MVMNQQQAVKKILFIYTETPLHAGSGRSLGSVDLPIQRERVTDYPMIQSSGVKGALRSEVRFSDPTKYYQLEKGEDGVTKIIDTPELTAIFGAADDTENQQAKSYAGAVTVGDARLLLFPVRSLQGVFAWVTSVDVLNRFARDAAALGLQLNWTLPDDEPSITDEVTECWAGEKVSFNTKDGLQVTLEDFTYAAKSHSVLNTVGDWLAKNVLPQKAGEYKYWRDNLPQHLVILRREDFRDFARYGTEVRTHIKIAPDTKTVQSGALWTVESLPTDTLLYSPLIINNSRAQVNEPQTANQIVQTLAEVLDNHRINLGGDETTGHGIVMLHFANGKVKNG
jgi:CRISPR-associated protein Cmr4